MPVHGINHINIRTTDIAASSQFYVDVFDFEFRSIPMGVGQANWLFDKNGRAIIHLRNMAVDSNSTGPIDHVALDCEGQADIVERLQARGMEYSVFNLQADHTLVLVKDPHGVMLELNFKGQPPDRS
jgi:catechol 2,3-dioxygenase-like lactoylglutathione lyase family enzyme